MSGSLVTGAGGFIGRALCSTLRREGREVIGLSRREGDVASPDALKHVSAVDHVFHLAARTFVPDSWADPCDFYRVNVLGTANVVEFCRRHGARLTYVSAYLYGQPERLPVTEDCVLKPNNPYALSKHLAEQLCAFYSAHYSVDVTVIRPFNVFGPGQASHFLIPQVVGQIREGRLIRVKDTAPRRDYVYVDDVADALISTFQAPRGYSVINIASGVSRTVNEVIGTIQSIAGTDLPVSSEGKARLNEIDDVYADISHARALLGWTPKVSFEEGIRRILLKTPAVAS